MRANLVVLALVAATSTHAAPESSAWTSEWLEKKAPEVFVQLSSETIEHGGVRVQSCHVEWYNYTGIEALPKCYVMNTSGAPASVRVDFVLLDQDRETIVASSLSHPGGLRDMTGAEVSQHIPMTEADTKRIKGARVRVMITRQ